MNLIKGWTATILAVGFSYSDVSEVGKMLLVFVTLAYTIWKWRQDYKKRKSINENSGNS